MLAVAAIYPVEVALGPHAFRVCSLLTAYLPLIFEK